MKDISEPTVHPLPPTYAGQTEEEEEREEEGLRHLPVTPASQAVSVRVCNILHYWRHGRACLASDSVGDPLRKYITFIYTLSQI